MRVLLGLFLLLSYYSHALAQVQQATIPCPLRAGQTAANPACQSAFPVALTGIGNDSIIYSSPTIADLHGHGTQEIIIGTQNGYLVAVNPDGTVDWTYKTGTVPINSKPAVGDLNGDGQVEVVVGAGAGNKVGGGVYVVDATGHLVCSFTALDPSHNQGMYSSPALGHLDPAKPNGLQIAIGSFDFHMRALEVPLGPSTDCIVFWEKGLNEYVVDTIWSSPAIYDLDQNGHDDVIIGQDSNLQTIPPSSGYTVPDGGMLRAFRGDGSIPASPAPGQAGGDLPGFPIRVNEVLFSSPAIGDLTGAGSMSIVIGNGRCWDTTLCLPANKLHPVDEDIYAWSTAGQVLPGWPAPGALDHSSNVTHNIGHDAFDASGESARTASAALGDLNGDGQLAAVINTLRKETAPTADFAGYVHALLPGGTESAGWPVQPFTPATCSTTVSNGTLASPVLADLDGDGFPEVILPSTGDVVIWDHLGNQLTEGALHNPGCNPPAGKYVLYNGLGNGAFYGSAAVADLDGDGHLEVVTGGTACVPNCTSPTLSGQYATIYAWTFPASNASDPKATPWPQFRHDVRNTGVYVRDAIFSDGFDN